MVRNGVMYLVIFLGFVSFQSTARSTQPSFRQQLNSAQSNTARLNIYRKIFNYYKDAGNDSAKAYLDEGLSYFEDHDYKYGRAILLGIRAADYSGQGLASAAAKAYQEELILYTQLKDEAEAAKVRKDLGVIEGRMGNYDEAVKNFLLALHYFEKARDTANIISTYVNLGTANTRSGNYSQALICNKKAIDLSLHTRESASTASLYNNLGSLYASRNDFANAKIQFEKALQISESIQSRQARIAPLMNLGNIYADVKQPLKALSYYKQSLTLARRTGSPEDICQALYSIGVLEGLDLHIKSGALDEAFLIAQTSGNKSLQVDILADMASVAHVNGEYEKEVRLLKQERSLSDSLFNLDKARELANLQAEYELNKTSNQLAELRLSEQRNLKKKNLIIVIAMVLGATLITMMFFFFKSIRLNRALSQREQELRKANAIKDRLFAIIGHDLRGPIANIPALLQIYRSDDTENDTKNYILDSLEENSEASLETLEKLLNWGNLQIKGNTLNKALFMVGGSFAHTISLLRVAANNKEITFINHVPEETLLYADENHFKFIVRNLLSNAVKYTRNNGVIEISAEKVSSDNTVRFRVKDNGVGIEDHMLEHIFEPYNQSTAGTAHELGTSIGLMLCREFVQMNGGRIWAESKKDEGSTFFFTLTAGDESNAAHVPQHSATNAMHFV